TTGCRPKMFMCTADAPDIAAPDSAIACIIRAASVMPRPAPPYSSGIAMPSHPPSASAACNSWGNAPLRSFSSQYVASNRAHSLRIASRICCCSWLREKSMAASARRYDLFDGGGNGQQFPVRIAFADQHEADRRVAGTMAGDRDRAAIEEVHDRGIAQ